MMRTALPVAALVSLLAVCGVRYAASNETSPFAIHNMTVSEYDYGIGSIKVNTPTAIFTLGPGSCLLGPLRIGRVDGSSYLTLSAGADLPPGCSKK